MSTHRTHRLTAAMLAAMMLCAYATPARPQSGTQVFLSGDFREHAPANALDMLRRVPGFTLVEADEDIRGYAGARGNVLIDGVRPGKREDIDDVLQRIPAADVERIELIYSGSGGIDMAGHPVLANIVRRRVATSERAIEAGALASTDGWLAPGMKFEYGRRRDDTAFDFAIGLTPELDDDSGRGTIRERSADGRTWQGSALHTRTTKHEADLGANWRQSLAGGQLALVAASRGERVRTGTIITALSAGADGETVNEAEDSREAELGARYVRAFGTRSVAELVASQQLAWLDSLEHSREDDGEERFAESTRTGESIARAEFSHEVSAGLSMRTSLEGAFNFLESTARLDEDGLPVDVPGSDVRIEEQRLEAAFAATWRPAGAWVFDAGLRIERSAISQTGDSPLQRRFTYPKPRIALGWDGGGRNRFSASLSREVGQLDFDDFIASASLEQGDVSAGNAELEPDKSWRGTLAWEHDFGADAAVTLSWSHDRITDVVDRVMVVAGDDMFDAPGNIGDGRRDIVSLDLSLPLDGIGIPGGHLQVSSAWRRSRVTDPVTGERRGISEEKPVEASIEFNQDLPRWRMTWGVVFEHLAERETRYRFDEVRRDSEDPGWTVHIERRLGAHWRLRAEATDLFGRDFEEIREQYDGPRGTVAASGSERRRRETPGTFLLSVRRSTGG